MRFSAIHKLSSYLMTLTAVAAVALSPDLSLVATALTLAGVGLSWFAEPARLRLDRYTAAWNIATVIFFFYLVTDVLRGEPVITAGAHFLLFVLVNKLFNRRTSRDYLQAYVVTFLLLVVATTMNNGISYAVCFAGYVLFATWTMTLFHLRREMEENYLLKHSEGAQSEKVEVERILNSRRIVGGSFLAGTSVVSLGIIIGAAAVFLLFPRIGFGLFVSQKRGGVAMVGFRDRVELGYHGVVRDNPTVVMRVVPEGGRRPGLLRWRGSAFDRYDKGTWSHSPQMLGEHERVASVGGMYMMNLAPGFLELDPTLVRGRLLRQDIYLEPLDSTVLFAADRPVAIELPRGRGAFEPRRGPFAEIHASKMRTAGVYYVAYSQTLTPSPAVLRQSLSVMDPRLREQLPRIESFLQVPRDLPPRIGELARRITAGKPTVFDEVLAVQDFLRKNYTYTLRLTHDRKREPVDEFLFETRRGHCEYFASAMALLLRTVGIPARSVNGFAGGEWNDFGKYLAVRQGDAHTWVEVLFSGVGWVTFDPTPGGLAPSSGGVIGTMRQLLDTLRMRWFRYVVEYDLRQQVSMVRRVQEAMRSPRVTRGLSVAQRLAIVGAAAAVVIALGVWLWRRRRGGGPSLRRRTTSRLSGASQLYARLLAVLARAGHSKPASTTAQELAEELVRRDLPAAKLVQQFVRCYYEARFGERAPDGELARLLREVRHEIRNHAGGEGGTAAVSR